MAKLKLKELDILLHPDQLAELPNGKLLINTINAHSYNTAQHDALFAEALSHSGALIPDGASVVMACRLIGAKCQPHKRCAGWDLFVFEMQRLETLAAAACNEAEEQDQPVYNGRRKVMFMGSSEKILTLIRQRAAIDYPHLDIVTYSPPYKAEFSDEDNRAIITAINTAQPDLLWIGMTAPKQEKWAYSHWKELNICCHTGTIGAVFDFYAGTVERAPIWWQQHSLEWLYRLIKEPRRMWRRYVLGNPLFLYNIVKEQF